MIDEHGGPSKQPMTAQQPPTMETAPAAQPKRKWKVPVLEKAVGNSFCWPSRVRERKRSGQRGRWRMASAFSALS
jgi:hypothetical protein